MGEANWSDLMSVLEISNISKTFSGKRVLKNISLSHEKDEALCLLGSSGSGKTTLLRIIAGLESPDNGRLFFEGEDMAGVPACRRRFGMMFQDFALFPHKNVFKNVSFGLEMEGKSKEAIRRRVTQTLRLVGLDGFEKRDVSSLSGGERQRAALARSLAPRPRLLLLDEPMGALDRSLRERLMIDLKKILKAAGVTAIFVTHDQSEAFAVSDSIAVMSEGRIIQKDSPINLYKRPAEAKIARFLGFKNIIDGVVREDGSVETGLGRIYPLSQKQKPGDDVMIVIRPEAARIISAKAPRRNMETVVSGRVKQSLFKGKYCQASLETKNGKLFHFDLPSAPPVGEITRLALRREEIWITKKES